jgi:hypothetical protein
MKKVFVVLVLGQALVAGSPFADYREEIQLLVDRMVELGGTETGLSDSARLAELIDISYDYTILNSPELATYRGDPRGQDRWTDQSEQALFRRRAEQKQFHRALVSIDRGPLTPAERVNLELLANQVEMSIEGYQFPQPPGGITGTYRYGDFMDAQGHGSGYYTTENHPARCASADS